MNPKDIIALVALIAFVVMAALGGFAIDRAAGFLAMAVAFLVVALLMGTRAE